MRIMVRKLLLNNRELKFKEKDLPCLIHGLPHAGSSLFTISLIADLYTQGEKILFLSGYPMAREEFSTQTSYKDEPDIADRRVIFVSREDKDLFIKLANGLPDIKERIVLIKNIDLFGEEVFTPVKDLGKLVLSGNIDECSWRESIAKIDFRTKIFFSGSNSLKIETPKLNKYEGFFQGKNAEGTVKIAD
jgi:hypothetical protein